MHALDTVGSPQMALSDQLAQMFWKYEKEIRKKKKTFEPQAGENLFFENLLSIGSNVLAQKTLTTVCDTRTGKKKMIFIKKWFITLALGIDSIAQQKKIGPQCIKWKYQRREPRWRCASYENVFVDK